MVQFGNGQYILIYIIRTRSTGLFKIGLTSQGNLTSRMNAFSKMLIGGFDIVLLILTYRPRLETDLHACFNNCKLIGEWFNPNDALMYYAYYVKSIADKYNIIYDVNEECRFDYNKLVSKDKQYLDENMLMLD